MIDAMKRFLHRAATILLASATLAIGGPATAGTIGISGTVLTAIGTDADDVLLAYVSGSNIEFVGTFFTAVTPGCTNGFSGVGPAKCSLVGLTEVRIDLAGGDDVMYLSDVGAVAMPAGMTPLEFIALGGVGNDILMGTAGNINRLWGGLGDDVLFGHPAGANCLDGGAGDNILVVDGSVPVSGCNGQEPVFTPLEPVPLPEPRSVTLVLIALWLAGLPHLRTRCPSRLAVPWKSAEGI